MREWMQTFTDYPGASACAAVVLVIIVFRLCACVLQVATVLKGGNVTGSEFEVQFGGKGDGS